MVISSLLLVFAIAAFFMLRMYSGGIKMASGIGSVRPVIIIDPGHGGIDGGAVGINGSVEKEINLQISEKLRDMLELGGFDVVMTRETDISIHDDTAKTTKEKKTSDLHNRMAIIESNPGSIFVSIHQNKFTLGSSKGAQVFYGPKNSESEALANLIQESIVSQVQNDNSRVVKKAGKNLYLLYYSETPSVLVECGFLSNSEDNKNLENPQYQDKIAFSIYMAIVEYYS